MMPVRNHWVGRLISCGCLAVTVALAGCGTSNAPKQAVSETASGTAPQQGASTIDPAKIAKCGGFTVDKAAQILGVPASDIEATSQLSYETLRICSFQSRSDSRKNISFSLGWEPSVDEAKASMAQERQNLGLAKRSIGGVTGSTDKGAALEEIPGLGDEAYYTQVNNTVVARVSNVRIQVMSAPNLEAYKQVAREVTKGLR